MAIPSLLGSYIDQTYQRLVQVSGSEFADGLGNPISFSGGGLSGGTNNYIPLWSGSTALTSSIASQQTGSITFNAPSVDVNDLYDWSGITSGFGYVSLQNYFGISIISSTTRSLVLDGNLEDYFGTPPPYVWTNITLFDNTFSAINIDDPYYADISSIAFYSQSFDGANYTVFYSSSISPGTVLPNTIYT